MPAKKETRSFEVRAGAQGEEFALVGYAARFNVLSKDLGGFREIISPGAFTRSLADGQNKCFCFQHSYDDILARTDNGSLQLSADEVGLRFRAQLNKAIQRHRDLYEACKANLYRECSFAFSVPEGGDSMARTSQGVIRTLLDVDVFEASLVGMPAYPETSAAARSLSTNATPAELLAQLNGKIADQENRSRAHEIGKQLAEKRGVLSNKELVDNVWGGGPGVPLGAFPLDPNKQGGDGAAVKTESQRLQELITARFGPSRAGHANKFLLVDSEISSMAADGSKSGVATCMNYDSEGGLQRVRIGFRIDVYGQVSFEDPEDERKYLASLQIA